MRKIIVKVLLLTLPLAIPLAMNFTVQSSYAFRCGTPFLKEGLVLPPSPDLGTAPRHPAAPALTVGFQRSFFAIDFARKQQYSINATLRASGTHCYIFVEDSEWQTHITTPTVQSVQRTFDSATPADPRRGIYDILTEDFGTPPDVDENDKVIILLLNILDRNTSYSTAGYFMPIDQYRGRLHHPTLGPLHSNEADIIYINSRNHPPNNNASDISNLQSVIAHELQHLIHWHHSPNEEIWIDEGCADYAAFQCGFNLYQHVNAFQKAPNTSLIDWTQQTETNLLAHYGAAFLFMLYFHDHYGGTETVAALVKNPLDGIPGITQTLKTQGINKSFSNIFSDWKVANYLTTWLTLGTVEDPYQYNSIVLAIQPQFEHVSYPANSKNRRLANFSAHAIECKVATVGQSGLTLGLSTQRQLNMSLGIIDVKATYLHTSGEIVVGKVPFRTVDGTATLDVPAFGTDIQRLMVIPSLQVENASFAQQTIAYDYSIFEGNLGTYTTHIFPNPIHPNYWEIIAVPNEPAAVHAFTVTLTYQNRKLLDAKPMIYLENEKTVPGYSIYRYAFNLKPDIATEKVKWTIKRGTGDISDRVIDEGILNEPITEY